MIDLSSFMSTLGERLITNGYHIIPIMPGTKVPGRHMNGEWNPYPFWSRHCDRVTKPFELDMWSRWPGCAIGLACGATVGIDIDIWDDPSHKDYPRCKPGEDHELALRLEQLAFKMLGETNAIRIGQQPKRALFYRAEVPFQGKKMHPLEVYARGSQMLIHAIHPGTQRPYVWPESSLLDLDISQLSAITEAQAMAWLEAAYNLVPAGLRPERLTSFSDGTSSWRGPSDPRGTYEAVKSALEYIPNTDLDGTSWIMVCNAIKAALGPTGRDLWIDWSRSSAKSGTSGKPRTAERRYDTARPTQIGAGTIYYLAEQRGWSPGSELILNGSVEEASSLPHPAAEMLTETDAAIARKARVMHLPAIPVSSDLLDVGGTIGALASLYVRTAISPQPFLALGCAITTVGVLAGRKYRSVSNLRTNLYTIGIADSGGGKDHARGITKDILFAAGLKEYLGGGKIASGSGLLTSLERHPCRVFLLDEMGRFVKSVTGPRVASHREEIWTNLTELYTSAGSIYLGAEYSDQKLRPRIDIVQPCCSIYGVTVPGSLWSALEGGSMADGSLARFLIFLTDNDYPDRNKRPDKIVFDDELIASLQAIANGAGEPSDLPPLSSMEPDLYEVPVTHGAVAMLDRLTDDQTDWLRSQSGTNATSVIARFWENVNKVAMIRAISDCPANPVITEVHVVWATKLVEHCTRTLLREADRFVADNQTEASHKRVLDIIRKAGSIRHNELTKKTYNLRDKERNEIIAALVEGQQIRKIVDKSDKPGRPGATYTATPQAETVTGPITYH